MIEHLRHLRLMRAAMGDAAPPPPPPIDCAADPVAGLKRMFVDQVQLGRIQAGQDPARRPVFLRLHGVAHARFEVVPGLPDDLRVGVFGEQGEYTAWVRFSSDLPDGRPDFKSTVGVGIKLFGVDGEKLLPPDQDASTHDFILQNFDVFFVDTAKDMCEFTQASLTSEALGRPLEQFARYAAWRWCDSPLCTGSRHSRSFQLSIVNWCSIVSRIDWISFRTFVVTSSATCRRSISDALFSLPGAARTIFPTAPCPSFCGSS